LRYGTLQNPDSTLGLCHSGSTVAVAVNPVGQVAFSPGKSHLPQPPKRLHVLWSRSNGSRQMRCLLNQTANAAVEAKGSDGRSPDDLFKLQSFYKADKDKLEDANFG
jgi:hypothetical protein